MIDTRWWNRRTCAHLLLWELQGYNLLLNNHQQENVGSHQKGILHIQGQRRGPSKMIGGAKSCLESNPLPTRDEQRAQTKPCMHQETPERLNQTCLWVFECLLWRHRSAVACHGDRGSGCSRPGRHGMWAPPQSTEQTTHKLEVIIPRNFLHCCKSSRAHNRFPNLGIWQRNWEHLGNLTLKASVIWLQNLHRTGETDPWSAQTKSCV